MLSRYIPKSRIIIVSNRLPLVIKRTANGKIRFEKGAGGLVTAMAPVLERQSGVWIGWTGAVRNGSDEDEADVRLALASNTTGYDIMPVSLDALDLKLYYEGFANSVLWPLFHGFTGPCLFRPEYWESYCRVNEKFSKAVEEGAVKGDFIWIHDYQLLLLGACLRKRKVANRLGFFLHIPFPAVEIFSRCPWRHELLCAMLEYDLIGFHTIQHKRNFIGCVNKLIREAKIDARAAFDQRISELTIRGRRVRIGVFPISIDYQQFRAAARDKSVRARARVIRQTTPGVLRLLGVDRLDYTKGIPEKLRAFNRFLDQYPKFRGRACLTQLVVPSRREIAAYGDLKLEIEQLVGEINGRFSTNGWVPVRYMYRSLDRQELVAMYRSSDVALVTPIKDGMNLVAKEYCTCNAGCKGVLVLSEFTGVAQQFHEHALIVNPHDTDRTAEAIARALDMPLAQKKRRMGKLRAAVKDRDVIWWLNSFLKAAVQKDLKGFARVDEYFPAPLVISGSHI